MNSPAQNAARAIPRVLVVDDEPDLRELLEITLVRMGLDVDSAATVAVARESLGRNSYALCLTDMRLPDGSGMELVETIARELPATLVAVITAFGSTDNAVAALKAGAFDYLSKPVSLEQLRNLVQAAVQSFRANTERPGTRPAAKDASSGKGESGNSDVLARLLGESAAMRDVRALIRRVARSQAPVAISGESGSGKELVARAIHSCSGRRDGPFVAVNCGAIPEQLMEAEFFGYRKGAFTGADSDRDGHFQTARAGTLFLDEVADLPLQMQVKLLRAIQERSVRRVGGMTEEQLDVRLVSATHQNLAQLVSQGKFRQDLYYRLNVIDIRIPPLRDRRDDIPLLAHHILKQMAPNMVLTDAAVEKLASYPFPGNVRELGNVLERSSAFSETDVIDAADLQLASFEPPVQLEAAIPAPTPVSLAPSVEPAAAALTGEVSVPVVAAAPNVLGFVGTLPEHLDRIEKEVIERALAQTRYNRTAAAELLGITFRQLRYRMQRLNIQ
jgi:two-component system response regulator PilR (NtrC family)